MQMIISLFKVYPLNEKRREVLGILLSVKGPVQAESGCLFCGIFEEYGEEQSVLFIEQWRSLPELERHIRSNSYARLLEVMELSAQTPEISFHETNESWGFELVERVRKN